LKVLVRYKGNALLARKERRKSARSAVQFDLTLRIPETNQTYCGTCYDLSDRGVRLSSDYIPKYGQILEICLPEKVGSQGFSSNFLIEVRRCCLRGKGSAYEVGGIVLEQGSMNIRQIGGGILVEQDSALFAQNIGPTGTKPT